MEFKNTEVYGANAAFRGMRNPMDSWDKSDSGYVDMEECYGEAFYDGTDCVYQIGEDDLKLAQVLLKSGNEHSKFMRMIHVSVDVDMPRYWWAEADCYKFGSKNSCSTMHTIMKKEITIDDFVVPQIIKDILHKSSKIKKKYTFKCVLPPNVKLESKVYSVNGYDYEIFNNGEIYSLPKDVPDSIGRIRHYDRKLMTIGQNSGEYFSVRLGGRNGGRLFPVHK